MSLYSYLSAHHLALLKTQIPYLAYVLEYSVTFLSGKSYSPDISLCKKAGLSDLRSLLEGMVYHAARLRLWITPSLVTSPDNLIIQYLSSLSMGYFKFFYNFPRFYFLLVEETGLAGIILQKAVSCQCRYTNSFFYFLYFHKLIKCFNSNYFVLLTLMLVYISYLITIF